MAVVIPFAPRRRSQGRVSAQETRTPGEILFFTGVRYERQPEPLPAAKPARRSPRSGSRSKTIAKTAGQPA